MPIPTAQKQAQRETLQGFLGVNLRRDRLNLADGEVARAINADLHRQPGTALVRLGRSDQFSTSLGDTIRRLAKHNGRRYQLAGTQLYTNQSSILTGLSTNLFTTLQPFRPLGDTTEWVYIADDNIMRKYDGTNVRNWGIIAPTLAPTLALTGGGTLTGDYTYVFTFARVVGSSVVTESDPSPTSSTITASSSFITATITEVSTDPQVTNIRLYRTVASGTTHFFRQQRDNTLGSLVDDDADTTLGAAVETDNEVPNTMSWVTEFQGHMFLCRDASNPHYLWWSKRFREEVGASNFLEIGHPSDPLQGALPLAGFLGVFARNTKYRVVGNQTSGFVAIEALSSRGTPAVQAALVTARGVIFPARDGLFVTNFLEPDRELTQAIEPLFYEQTVNDYAPIDWNRANEMALAEYKDRFYFSYPTTDGNNQLAVFSTDTQQWYFFNYDERYHALYVEEDVDDFIGGGPSGTVAILEDAAATSDAGNDIVMTLEPATRAGQDRFVTKLFQYIRADVDAKNGTINLDVYVNDVLVRTYTITGSRTRRLLRLPPNLLGETWRMTLRYTGQEQAAYHGIQMVYIPLRAA